MIKYLEATYDKSRRTIYPDLDGFSAALGISAVHLPETDRGRTRDGIIKSLDQSRDSRLRSLMTAAGLR